MTRRADLPPNSAADRRQAPAPTALWWQRLELLHVIRHNEVLACRMLEIIEGVREPAKKVVEHRPDLAELVDYWDLATQRLRSIVKRCA